MIPVLLDETSQDAEHRHPWHAKPIGNEGPIAGFVDERFADIEEDSLHRSHQSSWTFDRPAKRFQRNAGYRNIALLKGVLSEDEIPSEMPDMETVSRVFKGKKFQMMPVSLDIDSNAVSRFYRENNLTMPAYLDPDMNVASLYGVLGTPEIFIIDSEGPARSITSDCRSGRARRCSPGRTNLVP